MFDYSGQQIYATSLYQIRFEKSVEFSKIEELSEGEGGGVAIISCIVQLLVCW